MNSKSVELEGPGQKSIIDTPVSDMTPKNSKDKVLTKRTRK